jgi:hypothetical protein
MFARDLVLVASIITSFTAAVVSANPTQGQDSLTPKGKANQPNINKVQMLTKIQDNYCGR